MYHITKGFFVILVLFCAWSNNACQGDSLGEGDTKSVTLDNQKKEDGLVETISIPFENLTSSVKEESIGERNSTDQLVAGQLTITEKIQYFSTNSSEEDSEESEESEESGESRESGDLLEGGRRFGHIVGGVITEQEKFPFIVSLQYQGEHICGGSLIKPRWILTAAHCLDGFKFKDFAILAGETDAAPDSLPSTAQLVPVENGIIHNGYDTQLILNDIGLLYTQNPIQLSDTVTLITMATTKINRGLEPSELTDECTVIGWGDTRKQRRSGMTNPLRYVSLPVLSLEDCKKAAPDFYLTRRQICTMYPQGGKDSCQGDSGGPLVWKMNGEYILQGLVSYGEGCARANMPGIYTRVDAYTSWIVGHINQKRMKVGPGSSNSGFKPTGVFVTLLTISFCRFIGSL